MASILTPFQAVSLAQNGVSTSNVIPLDGKQGYFSMHMQVAGAGNIKVELLCSNDPTGVDYVVPSSGGTLDTAVGAGSKFVNVGFPLAQNCKLRITELNAGPVVVTIWLAVL